MNTLVEHTTAVAAAVVAGCMLLLWLVSLPLKNASIVDIFWGCGFVVVGAVFFAASDKDAHATLLFALVTAWGVRLSLHLAARNLGKGEDPRYVMLRKKHDPFWIKSLFIVFLLQAVLLFIVSLPLQVGMAPRALDGASLVVSIAGAVIFFVGFFCEALADLQLVRFKADPNSKGQVMDRGLWKFSRHPNYFGEIVLWWGLGLIAFDPHDTAAAVASSVAFVGPAVITFLLLRVSGVPMLEGPLQKNRPGYADYVARTNAMIPWFPRAPKQQ